jgi:DNA-binding SARP family transcriptional activator/tetratricopeptide (TPR) repeat protein
MSGPRDVHDPGSPSHGLRQPLHVRLLGGFSLSTPSGGGLVLSGSRPRALLTYLLLHRDRPVDRRHLAFLLWPDSAEGQALTNLRQLLHDVRARIPDADRFIEAGRQLVQWRENAPFVLDVDRFEAAIGRVPPQGGSRNTETTIASLVEGIALYAGDLLPECYDEWIEPPRRRLRDLLIGALRRVIGLLEERRDHAAAILHAERLRELEPLDESAAGAVMRLLAAQGRRAQALDAYTRTEALLKEELGAAPMPALRELRDRLLRAPPDEEPSLTTSRTEPALIDRAAEWTALTRAWATATRAHPRCLLLSGIPGIGKTRLCAEFATWATRQGATVATSSCYRTVGSLPYAPVVDWLRSPMLAGTVADMAAEWRAELTGLLPDLAGAGAATPSESSAGTRRRLFDALVRAIGASPPPRLLVLDDIQWADRETLEWIRFLMSAEEPRSLVLLAAHRAGEPPAENRLEDVLRDLRHDGRLEVIEVEPLDEPDTAALAAAAGDKPLEASAAEELYRETEGHPLYIVEMTRASAEGFARPAPTSGKRVLPDRVMATIEGRLALLTPATLDVLGVASVIGREFGTELLAAGSGTREPEVAAAVEELVVRRLVRERGAGVYDFSHDSIREVAYARLGADRRRLLHRGIAQAQIAAAGTAPASASAIAKHLERGGFIEGAIPFYRMAAEHALGVFAGTEAVALYEQALELLGRLPHSPGRLVQEIELRTALCVALVSLEMFSGPRMTQEYARLGALCERAGISPGPPALRTIAIALLMRGEMAEGNRIGGQLLAAVPAAGDPVLLAEACYVLGAAAYWRGDPESSARHFRAGLDAYRPALAGEHVKTYGQDAGVVNGVRLALTLCLLDQHEAARQALSEALARADILGHPHTLAYVRQFGAWALIELGDEIEARRQIEGAVEVAEAYGLPGWPIRNTALLGYLIGRSGEVDRGIAMMRSAAEQWAARGWRIIVPYDRSLLARLYLTTARVAEGLSAIEEGLTVAGETGQPFWTAELLRLKGELLERSGAPPAESRQAFVQALELARAQGARALVRRVEESLQLRRNAGRTRAE